MKYRILALVLLLALFAAGCDALEIGVNTGRAGASIDVTVSEAELNRLLQDVSVSEEGGPSIVPSVQFGVGQIILGATISDVSGGTASGSITFVLTQEGNEARLYPTNVALSGADTSGAQVLNLNLALNREIAAATQGQTGATFVGADDSLYIESIVIVPGTLSFRIRLPRS